MQLRMKVAVGGCSLRLEEIKNPLPNHKKIITRKDNKWNT